MERLSKFLSQSGVASRRKAEAIVKDGLVKVNDRKVLDPFYRIDPHKDRVTVDNCTVSVTASKRVYVALHKPSGYISDLADPKGRPLARSLIPIGGRLYPVGRLDFASEGLIIFTNDGEFANRILHPRYEVIREYHVKVQKVLAPSEMGVLTAGRKFDGVLYRISSVKLMKLTDKNAWYIMRAAEGRNRLIRKLVESMGHTVLRLRRVRMGPVLLGDLKPGRFRHLSLDEIGGFLNKP
jgi:23S rRNA pseudouridine2605 synthase